MRRLSAILPPLLALLWLASPALAQQSNEDRLREALKRQMVELRAAQDAQASLQAQIGDLTRQRDALQALLDQARAQAAAAAAAAPPAPTIDPAELALLRKDLAAARAENADLKAALVKWQAAYKEAAALAQARDAEVKRLGGVLKAVGGSLDACKQANAKLIGTARDILHLYETREFRALLVQSTDPLLGLKRVDLENLVQDYEDRVYGDRFPAPPKAGP